MFNLFSTHILPIRPLPSLFLLSCSIFMRSKIINLVFCLKMFISILCMLSIYIYTHLCLLLYVSCCYFSLMCPWDGEGGGEIMFFIMRGKERGGGGGRGDSMVSRYRLDRVHKPRIGKFQGRLWGVFIPPYASLWLGTDFIRGP